MTTFKALLVLRNSNPVCQSSLWGLAEPCRDRALPSRSSLSLGSRASTKGSRETAPGRAGSAVTGRECRAGHLHLLSPGCHLPLEHPPRPHPPQTQRWAVHVQVTGGSHLLWTPQLGSSANKNQGRAFKPLTAQSQVRDAQSYQGVISEPGRSLSGMV